MARCFVTRQLPGPALGRLEVAHDVEVWPGHLGGSMCGGPGMDLKICSTVGFELHHNELLRVEELLGPSAQFLGRKAFRQ